ncbi:MAG: hypothetical protein NTY66_04710 [Candidatus Vogelbacteria bacterium]|nr:hypothetical protein [Candidatus Vogelbacteria bacterium]
MSTPILSIHERLKLSLDLQQVIASFAPEHLAHLHDEFGPGDLTMGERLSHFAGQYSEMDAIQFAFRFRQIFGDNWDDIVSSDNWWYAGELYRHSPTAFEAALYFFAAKGFFGLKPEMIPEVIAAFERPGQQTPDS